MRFVRGDTCPKRCTVLRQKIIPNSNPLLRDACNSLWLARRVLGCVHARVALQYRPGGRTKRCATTKDGGWRFSLNEELNSTSIRRAKPRPRWHASASPSTEEVSARLLPSTTT